MAGTYEKPEEDGGDDQYRLIALLALFNLASLGLVSWLLW
jgi:hypothetical protein